MQIEGKGSTHVQPYISCTDGGYGAARSLQAGEGIGIDVTSSEIVVRLASTQGDSDAEYYVAAAHSSLPNAKLLIEGDGITLSSGDLGLTISAVSSSTDVNILTGTGTSIGPLVGDGSGGVEVGTFPAQTTYTADEVTLHLSTATFGIASTVVLCTEASTNVVTDVVSVGANPQGVAITPDGLFAYVANMDDCTVSVIDTLTNTVASTVGVGTDPYRVAITPDGLLVYVTNRSSANVSVIDTLTNTVASTVDVGTDPYDVAITPDGLFAYVTNSADDTVSVIDTLTNTVASTVAVGDFPVGIAITPDGLLAYVANYNDSTLSVIDTVTNTVASTIADVQHPGFMATTPNSLFAYVTNRVDDNVLLINTVTNTVASTITVGNQPADVKITPDGFFAYVINSADNTVSIISTLTNTVASTITVGGNSYGVAITPDGLFTYVTSIVVDTVSVINILGVDGVKQWNAAPITTAKGGLGLDASTATAGQVPVADGSGAFTLSTLFTSGSGTLASGTQTVTTSSITANSRVFLSSSGGDVSNLGFIYEDAANRTPGASFITLSTNASDASDFNWMIVEA
jgi:YVTN family beta-propeller protein